MKKLLVLAALTLSAAPVVLAGNADAGQGKAAACAACHNADGNSVNAIWPKLAGQNEAYLVKQLKDFKKGMETQGKAGRFEATMAPMAAMLATDADIADVAAYFAKQKTQMAAAKKDSLEAGKKLYNGGDTSKGVPACTACHAPNGAGMPAAGFPRVGGQHVDYTVKTLKDFRSGARANDNNAIMRDIAKRLSDEQMAAVANYMSGLH